MARDFRHKHPQPAQNSFKRKSQVATKKSYSGKPVLPMMWAGGFLVSTVLLIGFFVNQQLSIEESSLADGIVSKELNQSKPSQVSSELPVSKELESKEAKPAPVVVAALEVKPEKVTIEPDKTVYSFYEGLSKMEVVIDAEPLSVELKQPLYIQAGTFGSRKVAESELRRLAKLGQNLELSVLTTKVRTYYRLRVGPFTDRLVMNKRRNELRRLGVDTLLVKMSKS